MTANSRTITAEQLPSRSMVVSTSSCRKDDTSTRNGSQANISATLDELRQADYHHLISVPTKSPENANSAGPPQKPSSAEFKISPPGTIQDEAESHSTPHLYLHRGFSIPVTQKVAMTATMGEDLDIQLSDAKFELPKENEVVVRIAWTGMCRSVCSSHPFAQIFDTAQDSIPRNLHETNPAIQHRMLASPSDLSQDFRATTTSPATRVLATSLPATIPLWSDDPWPPATLGTRVRRAGFASSAFQSPVAATRPFPNTIKALSNNT